LTERAYLAAASDAVNGAVRSALDTTIRDDSRSFGVVYH